ncbi:MAG: porphobilinogen synthase [Thermoplasmata archaeon]|nr:porphobilinogen synthase [Candidatus Sysuiplasma acidicola]
MRQYPVSRLRRYRKKSVRRMLSSFEISPSKLIYPVFVDETLDEKKEIAPMPGQFRYPVDGLQEICKRAEELGIGAVMLFGLPSEKNDGGTGAYDDDGIVQKAVRAIRKKSSIAIITDLCLCEYTTHGQCGIMNSDGVDNDATLELYGRIAVSQAMAGAEWIAPSGMMDGQVGHIRKALDTAGFQDVSILAYAAKSASSFYGPFREAAGSTPSDGDRKGHQLNYASRFEQMLEIEADIAEGADIVMVKPALPNLDIICKARDRYGVPVAAYNVSGEYSMLRASAMNGWTDYRGTVEETLISIFRAGADLIVTYHAIEASEWITGK